jgi:hypothetical protein
MSTSYRAIATIAADRLFDGCMQEFTIHEYIKLDETSSTWRCLTDGLNFVWVDIVDGMVTTFNRYAGNDSTKILAAVASVFQTEILSEYQPQYWGFDTDEEWEAAIEMMAMEDMENDRKFQENLRKFLRGQPHDLKLETNEMVQAEIAKSLILRVPELILEQNEACLKAEIRKVYVQNRAAFDDVPF